MTAAGNSTAAGASFLPSPLCFFAALVGVVGRGGVVDLFVSILKPKSKSHTEVTFLRQEPDSYLLPVRAVSEYYNLSWSQGLTTTTSAAFVEEAQRMTGRCTPPVYAGDPSVRCIRTASRNGWHIPIKIFANSATRSINSSLVMLQICLKSSLPK